MVRFNCPLALSFKEHPYLVCSAQMKDGKDYRQAGNAVTAFCLHQEECNCERRAVNTEGAAECYRDLSAKLEAKRQVTEARNAAKSTSRKSE